MDQVLTSYSWWLIKELSMQDLEKAFCRLIVRGAFVTGFWGDNPLIFLPNINTCGLVLCDNNAVISNNTEGYWISQSGIRNCPNNWAWAAVCAFAFWFCVPLLGCKNPRIWRIKSPFDQIWSCLTILHLKDEQFHSPHCYILSRYLPANNLFSFGWLAPIFADFTTNQELSLFFLPSHVLEQPREVVCLSFFALEKRFPFRHEEHPVFVPI